MSRKLHVLITGSHGYIGRNLLESYKDSYTLYAPSHKTLDLLDEAAVENYFIRQKIDIVVHCAVSGGSRRSEQVDGSFFKNTKMFFNIVRNKKHFERMIFLGSGAEYDNSRPLIRVKETAFDRYIPKDEYGYHKYICSKFIEQVNYIVNLRVFGMFGKYEDYTLRFISNAMAKNVLGFSITMQQNVFIDYVYINDLVRIVDYFITHKPKEKFYNIGRGEKIDLLTIANIINKISEKKSSIIVRKSGLKKEYTCDNSRLKKELENFSFTPFDESLRQLYKWYDSIKHTLNKNELRKDKE